MITVGIAVISLFRKERGRAGAVIVIVLAIGLVLLNAADMQAPTTSNLSSAEVVDWNWQKDPTFGGHGTIKWNVEVRNKSTQNISNVKVGFATYDDQRKLVASTFTYVQAIPAGQTRTENGYADLYGTEQKAMVQIQEVNFAR
jgi:hypothetical protein